MGLSFKLFIKTNLAFHFVYSTHYSTMACIKPKPAFHSNAESIYFIGNGSEYILGVVAWHLRKSIRTTRVKLHSRKKKSKIKFFVVKSIYFADAKTEIHSINTCQATAHDVAVLMAHNTCKAIFFVFDSMKRYNKHIHLNYVLQLMKASELQSMKAQTTQIKFTAIVWKDLCLNKVFTRDNIRDNNWLKINKYISTKQQSIRIESIFYIHSTDRNDDSVGLLIVEVLNKDLIISKRLCCFVCHVITCRDKKVRVCKRCKQVWYCSRKCQKLHWSEKGCKKFPVCGKVQCEKPVPHRLKCSHFSV